MEKLNLVEVAPRDGFQSVNQFIPTKIKLEIIDKLVLSGFKKIQVTSFISPKIIPQMQDAREVARTAVEKYPDVRFFALVHDFCGASAAIKEGKLKEISPVMSLSNSYSQAIFKKTNNECIEEIQRIINAFPDVKITQEITTAFSCPYEGKMDISFLIGLLCRLHEIGIYEYTLYDTIGTAHPKQIARTLHALKLAFPESKFSLHLHNSCNMGMINSYTALLNGAESVQTSIGGLGGCPFVPGVSGNVPSEDLVYTLHSDGYDTGLDFDELLRTAKFVYSNIEGNYSGYQIRIPESFNIKEPNKNRTNNLHS